MFFGITRRVLLINPCENHIVKTAQYSLHVVGLIFDPERDRVIIADSNGASNMEFLSMPLKTRRASDSTRGREL